jgi:transketolase
MNEKWSSFGWKVYEVDGHNFQDLARVFAATLREKNKPSLIIAHTIKGKGLSAIEDNNDFHYKTPREAELQVAKQEELL